MDIKCILFDLDNTLIETRKADAHTCEKIAQELASRFNVQLNDASEMSTKFLLNFRKCPENTRMTLEEWRSYLWRQALGSKFRQYADTIYKLWLHQRYENLALTPEIINLLETLRKKYQIALITNGTSAAQWEKIDKLDIREYFDLILVSGDLPYEKPDKNIFFQACEYLNVHPKDCLMVGDKLETDIQGGLEAGLAGTVWIPLTSGYNLVKSDPQPDYIIKHVKELKKVLNGYFIWKRTRTRTLAMVASM
ncbi:N-acylneuraminate-9-phosphatase isoform X2 [Anthonomus grandis grandis]|uniref:N-acylneuraminate-9-phosphatase isoform X2 n=1 Tax=Anthonomus grandis grandis TaxID=2921223 RepID=UPI002165690D|nr:N-acylneuraminate-9-phosphatase isoform X2 [Anthonomus grandis grandis]